MVFAHAGRDGFTLIAFDIRLGRTGQRLAGRIDLYSLFIDTRRCCINVEEFSALRWCAKPGPMLWLEFDSTEHTTGYLSNFFYMNQAGVYAHLTYILSVLS